MQTIELDYINLQDKKLTTQFIHDTKVKKYILGINSLTKSVIKHIQVDGIIDDFTRVQSSKKKNILQIDDIPKDAIILCTSLGSPLEVHNKLKEMGYTNFNYFSFYRYANLELKALPFINDFLDDFKNNKTKYEEVYKVLEDTKSKAIFSKVLNFKISFDIEFMQGFTNDFEQQYFDQEILPEIKNIVFVDGGGYVGDTLPNIISHYPDFKKIYCIEPNELHLGIAKRDYAHYSNIEFVQCGLGSHQISSKESTNPQHNCEHDFHASNINSLDNLINQKVDYIKLDIEGAEQDAISGAKETILKYHPILAICIYHKASDWYMVPQLVLAMRNDYKIYIRHYMEGIYETVMYFIPYKSS